MNKFMRMLVFFDLPVVTAKEKKDAAKFRKFLLKDGYHMVQWSVYSRICNGMDAVAMHKQRLNEYYGAAEPPVRCGESHLSGLTEPLRSL